MDAKTYQELIELIEGQRSINNQQAEVIQENLINELMKNLAE